MQYQFAYMNYLQEARFENDTKQYRLQFNRAIKRSGMSEKGIALAKQKTLTKA